ncbi:MAG: response regulator [Nitrospiria bacterium]
MERHCILIVDDEPNIRSSLSRLFQKEGYETLLAESADDAYTLLEKRSVSVVLADYLMPGQTGVELLREVQKRYPDAIRIILSGRADMKVVMAAVDEGVVSHFLLKPWDNEILKKTIRHAIEAVEKEAHLHMALQGDDETEIDEALETSYPDIAIVRETDDGAIIIDE